MFFLELNHDTLAISYQIDQCHFFSIHPGNPGSTQSVQTVTAKVPPTALRLDTWQSLVKFRRAGDTLESVFNALVQLYFNYCSEVWGHCNKSLSNKLQKLQNRAARILTFSSYDTSADPLPEQLNWKRLDTQRQIQVATMVYKSIHGLAPACARLSWFSFH